MITGFSGGGKSTLAKNLGEILNIKPMYIDSIQWLPGWVANTHENKNSAIAEVLKNDKWIIDGNYSKNLWLERLERADTVIFIDINRFSCFYSAWRRSRIYKGQTRPDMGEGCTEKFDAEFMKWLLIDGRRGRKRKLKFMRELEKNGKTVYIFKSKKSINNFLKGFEQK